MGTIPTSRVTTYVARPDAKVRAFLLFGTDAGLIRENTAALCKSLSATAGGAPEIIRLTEDDLASAPDKLAVEIQTVSMFSLQKIVRAKIAGRLATELAQFDWDSVPDTTRVVIEAGNLKKDAKLRRLFEKSPQLAALACHDSDDPGPVIQLVRRELADAGITIDTEAERHLTTLLGGDPGVAKSEIAKLVTYAQGQDRLSITDIEAVVGDTSRATLDVAVDAILDGDATGSLRQMGKLQLEGIPVDALLYALGQHVLRLIRLRAGMDAGESTDTTLRGFRPPLHFRRAGKMKQQVRKWGRDDLRWALELASRAQRKARLDPQLDEQIAADLVFRVARAQAQRGMER